MNIIRTFLLFCLNVMRTLSLFCQKDFLPQKFLIKKELTRNLYSSIFSLISSFTLCSESSLRSHLLLQQLDSFENVLENLVQRYYDICYNELDVSSKLTEHNNNQHNRKTNNNSDNHTYEQLIQGKKKNDNNRENNAEERSVPAYYSLQEKVKYLCTFLLSSMDRISLSSSVDSDYFFLRYVSNMMVSCFVCCILLIFQIIFLYVYFITKSQILVI